MTPGSVWFAVPTIDPPRASATFARWRARGYKTAAFVDAGETRRPDADLVITGGYTGYAAAINALAAALFHPVGCEPPEAMVIGGDDHDPDPKHTAAEMLVIFRGRFPHLFGVMQPTGDKFPGNGHAATCPWIGRRFVQLAYSGLGPLNDSYFHFNVDCELRDAAIQLGCYQERPDLSQYHHHWTRDPLKRGRPEHLARAVGENPRDRAVFEQRREHHFPGVMELDFQLRDYGATRIMNLDLGRELTHVTWCDILTGEFVAMETDADGVATIDSGTDEPMKWSGRARLRIVFDDGLTLETPIR